MTEVVTSTAAYVQPLLHASRQQVFGVPNLDSPQSDLAIALAAGQQQDALDATLVAPATDDRASLTSDRNDSNQAAPRSFTNQPPQANPAKSDAPPTTGPAKARVEINVADLTAAANAPLQKETPVVAAAVAPHVVDAPKPAAPVPTPAAAPTPSVPQPAEQPRPQASGVLGPAAVLKDADIDAIADSIFGAAFAPTQVIQPPTEAAPQGQKNFIFAQRKLFDDEDVVASATGKFTPTEVKAAALGLGPDSPQSKYTTQTVAVAATTVGAQFAASAAAAQKLFDAGPVTVSGARFDPAANDVRLYDKVPQADTQNQSGQDQSGASGNDGQSLDSRESLYQRAQAVADALGEKSSNPAVKQLVATLESYAAIAGINTKHAKSTVRVIA
jgi:hypothetical protein